MLTLKSLNKKLAVLGVELIKGNGYFWISGLTEDVGTEKLESASIYVAKLNDLTEDQWVARISSMLSVNQTYTFQQLTERQQDQAVARFFDAGVADGYKYQITHDGNVLCRNRN